MTVYTQATNQVAGGVQYSLTGGDSLLVYQGVTLGSTTANAILLAGATSTAFIAGTLFGGSANGVASVVEGTLNIASTGAVTGNEGLGNGAVLMNTGASVSNDGSITSSGGYGIIVNGLGSSVINAGHVTGGTGGVFMGLFDSDGQTLTNTGSITAGARPMSGARYGHGVQVEGDGIVVFNAGTIIATGTGRAGIHLGGYSPAEFASGLRVTNDGVIQSLRGWGIDGIENLNAGFTLHNSGTISGSLGAVRGTGGADVVVNTGVIAGNVALGAGLDTYRGAAAAAAVSVDGGAGFDLLAGGVFDDSLYGGSDGDTLRGGAGDDSLQGGAGTDALYGGVGDDTMVGGAGNDIYRVASLADVVTEAGGAANGTADRIINSTVSVDLTLYTNVEAATLTGILALNLQGSGVANSLSGNAAANRITGGAGADTMTGADGADVFVFRAQTDTGPSARSRDTITDFTHGEDKINLHAFMAGGIFVGALSGANQVDFDPVRHLLLGSTDADAAAEWTIQLQPGVSVSAGDLVF
jgi:RTX calcium-binding nonapeptide repeat (4 copies)